MVMYGDLVDVWDVWGNNVCRLGGRWYVLTLGCVDFNVYLCA